MARRASSFTQVQRPRTESRVGQVFPLPAAAENLPEMIVIAMACQGATVNKDIRPPLGELWSVLIAKISVVVFTSPDPGTRIRIRILATDDAGVTFYEIAGAQLAQGATFAAGGTTASLGGSGSSFTLSNTRYLRFVGDSDSTAGTQNADCVAFVRKL